MNIRLFVAFLCILPLVGMGQSQKGNSQHLAKVMAKASANAINPAGEQDASREQHWQDLLTEGGLRLATCQQQTGSDHLVCQTRNLNFIFSIATNRYAPACYQIARLLQTGALGKRDDVAAYTWLYLAAEFSRETNYLQELDAAACQLSLQQVQEAQGRAAEFAQGNWPSYFVTPVEQGDPRLSLDGCSISSAGAMLILNRKTIRSGESVVIEYVNGGKRHPLRVSCVEIGSRYAVFEIEGEPVRKILELPR